MNMLNVFLDVIELSSVPTISFSEAFKCINAINAESIRTNQIERMLGMVSSLARGVLTSIVAFIRPQGPVTMSEIYNTYNSYAAEKHLQKLGSIGELRQNLDALASYSLVTGGSRGYGRSARPDTVSDDNFPVANKVLCFLICIGHIAAGTVHRHCTT